VTTTVVGFDGEGLAKLPGIFSGTGSEDLGSTALRLSISAWDETPPIPGCGSPNNPICQISDQQFLNYRFDLTVNGVTEGTCTITGTVETRGAGETGAPVLRSCYMRNEQTGQDRFSMRLAAGDRVQVVRTALGGAERSGPSSWAADFSNVNDPWE
jgi:hypothetical protein